MVRGMENLSSIRPTKTIITAPVPKAHKKGVGLIKSTRDRSKETAIASPPILGIGFMWTLRASGKSRSPIKRAILLERGVKMRDSKRDV